MYIQHNQRIGANTSALNKLFFLQTPIISRFNMVPFLRTIVELIAAVILIILLFPILIIVSTLILLTSKGGVLYSQTRIGFKGKPFEIYKFRTMASNAEASSGPVLATEHDSRVTALGRILRKTHLDELPQLLNVLKGEMSFVGPRPERPFFVDKFNKSINAYSDRAEVKPGITGLAQICLSYDATAKEKINFDLMYIRNKDSVLVNTLIAYYTAKKMIFFRSYKGVI